jgi:hypothetical protein
LTGIAETLVSDRMANDSQSRPTAPQGKTPKLQSSKQGQPIIAKFFTTRNLSVVVVGAVLVIAIIRADPKDIPTIVQTLVDSRSTAIIGWSIALIILIGAVVFIRLLTYVYEKEIERICKERDKLQSKLLGDVQKIEDQT